MHAHFVDTPFAGRQEQGLAAVSLQYLFNYLLVKGVRSLVIWLPTSRFRILSGGILDYKVMFSPSSGK